MFRFPGGVDLQFIVKELAKDLDLNVLFDAESRLENRTVKIELKNVTAAKALDYIFLQENLFFQKVGPRTILVATGTSPTNFQQLVLRTFYLANASPKDVKAVITAAIPAQPGRSQTIVLEDAATNSITVRDTEENIALSASLSRRSIRTGRKSLWTSRSTRSTRQTCCSSVTRSERRHSWQISAASAAPLVRAGGRSSASFRCTLGYRTAHSPAIATRAADRVRSGALQSKNNTKCRVDADPRV